MTRSRPADSCDLLVIGAGAAGLFAAIHAGREGAAAGGGLSIHAVDSARRLGAKILVAGGGRCNVTHESVSEQDFAGSSPAAIRKVLRRFSVDDTRAFFTAAGVELKREETGKLFPVSDSARSVLEALLSEAAAAGVAIEHPARTETIEPLAEGFRVNSTAGTRFARRVILATGGKSLPKSGSDGSGHRLAAALGHSLSEPILPALVPLVLEAGHPLRELSGLTLPAAITLSTATGRRLFRTRGSTLCTHTGLSGPSVLDVSRHYLVARHADAAVKLSIDWLPDLCDEHVDARLREPGHRGVMGLLRGMLPERLARMLCDLAECSQAGDVSREARRRLVGLIKRMPLPVVGDRGFAIAEATAGGVPLTELRLETMESRIVPGLHLVGELLDVDGRIGGFNFQWAWASGFVAGRAAARALLQADSPGKRASAPRPPAPPRK